MAEAGTKLSLDQKIQAVRDAFEAFNRGDWEAFESTATSDAVHKEPGTGRVFTRQAEGTANAKGWKSAFPDAHGEIVNAFGGGDQVCLDAIVRNTGQTVLRTEGPDPGYVYSSLDTFASIENHAFAEHAGFWRLGMSASGSTDLSGATYPYRWGFGHDLQPGDEASVHGCINVLDEQDKLIYFSGLVQENVAIHSAGAGLVRVQISS